ncbi:unnamed protein product [Albugo candida]|uniref:Uncharacterized protein n=1 Tax=Albugo candida TaxID=65357 RepID=A0A024GHX9_9STRA|nr:unnamed protein product [Albugo candida]|eukprot:CCI45918.1 unnamed protein product [Albugo candida]
MAFVKEKIDKANIGKDEDNALKPVECKNHIDKRSFMLPSQGRRHDSIHSSLFDVKPRIWTNFRAPNRHLHSDFITK